jgi:drug/metabolite transporter (DMT)-like permease
MLFFAAYLALAQRSRTAQSIWVYVVPLYAVAGLSALLLALPIANPFHTYAPREIALIAGLVLIPTVGGHSSLNISMSRMRGQTVALVNLTQVGFAALLAVPILRETPAALFYPALALIVAGAAIVIYGEQRERAGATGAKTQTVET